MDSDSVGRAFTSGELSRGPAILVRHGTSLPPVIPPDRLYLATAYRPVSRYPRAQRSRCRVHSRHSDAPARSAQKPLASVPELAGRVLARFGDLVSHGLPQHYDERGRRYCATRQLIDRFRNVIRCYSE